MFLLLLRVTGGVPWWMIWVPDCFAECFDVKVQSSSPRLYIIGESDPKSGSASSLLEEEVGFCCSAQAWPRVCRRSSLSCSVGLGPACPQGPALFPEPLLIFAFPSLSKEVPRTPRLSELAPARLLNLLFPFCADSNSSIPEPLPNPPPEPPAELGTELHTHLLLDIDNDTESTAL